MGGFNMSGESKLNPRALSDLIKSTLKKEGLATGLHPSALRKHHAFDLLIGRISKNAPSSFILKGGYLMELRAVTGRTTLDLDLLMRTQRTFESPEATHQYLRRSLAEATLTAVDHMDEFFSFEFGGGIKVIEGGGGGVRLPVKLLLAGKVFEEFHVDLVLEDIRTRVVTVSKVPVIPPITGKTFEIECISKEQHFAEKVHAYTRPREQGNSRIKDYLDLYLLSTANLDMVEAKIVTGEVFKYWSTHSVPATLPNPPEEWAVGFLRMAEGLGLDKLTIEKATETINAFYTKAFNRGKGIER
ncbi:MAG: hypothetical protein EOP04_01940 [Proteobacteria bacterium]|nr:MAG: hypothetical protein EOP04_01940 [Pseudomonadota bacterium]